ncbi:CoA transferase [Chitinimonas koreensis]|uniref:CoA transferase n=1 Tax=Chitinimonas koreensis TaxID=356302 RepID=UPI00042A4209|nr:CoA transferase [Chitinimonas koreensis]QNM95018.1 CoA transferase [Chitinimonas koreensis]
MPASPAQALAQLWQAAGLDPAARVHARLDGEAVLPSSFAADLAAQAAIAAAGLAAASLHRLRGGDWQAVRVDRRHAAIECRSERYLRVDGLPAPDPWDAIAGAYRCGDGRWVRLHTNFPHHRDGVLDLLRCSHQREAVTQALQRWRAEEFEQAAAERGLVVAMARSFEQWDAHPQAAALAALPPFTLEKIGDAPPWRPTRAARPLAGLRALDLTRVIAGPVCGRTLAAHGAEVLLLSSPNLPSIAPLVVDTGRGKRSSHLDLRGDGGPAALDRLLDQADLFVQGYRPGGLAALGFGPEAVAARRPGIVYVSLSAYGHVGPWAGRRGFDSLVQTATGFNRAEAQAAGQDGLRPLPMQILDHASGYLMALGAMAALHRRATEGGSWHVRVSLAQTGRWLRGLGRVDGLARPDPGFDTVGDLLEEVDSGFGRLTVVRHAAQLAATPAAWARPSVPLGTHAAAWPCDELTPQPL